MKIDRQCPECGRTYQADTVRLGFGRQTTCSRKCSYAARAAAKVKAQPLACGACGKVISVAPSRAARANHGMSFCSRECAYAKRMRRSWRVKRPKVLLPQTFTRVSRFEKKVASTFRRLGFAIETGVAIRRENGTYACVLDIVVPSRRLVVECHGSYWHGARWTWTEGSEVQKKNLIYEDRKHALLKVIGFDLRLLWEHDFRRDPVGACLVSVR